MSFTQKVSFTRPETCVVQTLCLYVFLVCKRSLPYNTAPAPALIFEGHTPLDYSRFGRGDTISLQPPATRTKSLGRCTLTGGLRYTWALGTL